MSNKTYQLKKTRKKAIKGLEQNAKNKSTFKTLKTWKLTCIDEVRVNAGDSASILARDYVQALEHALWTTGFSLVKESKKK